jgi:hypothetical protein
MKPIVTAGYNIQTKKHERRFYGKIALELFIPYDPAGGDQSAQQAAVEAEETLRALVAATGRMAGEDVEFDTVANVRVDEGPVDIDRL